MPALAAWPAHQAGEQAERGHDGPEKERKDGVEGLVEVEQRQEIFRDEQSEPLHAR
jgi:hypothetical protein